MAKKVAYVKKEDCVGCEVCVDVCPTKALEMKNDVAWSDPAKCDGEEKCGKCSPECPVECIVYLDESDPKLKA